MLPWGGDGLRAYSLAGTPARQQL